MQMNERLKKDASAILVSLKSAKIALCFDNDACEAFLECARTISMRLLSNAVMYDDRNNKRRAKRIVALLERVYDHNTGRLINNAKTDLNLSKAIEIASMLAN